MAIPINSPTIKQVARYKLNNINTKIDLQNSNIEEIDYNNHINSEANKQSSTILLATCLGNISTSFASVLDKFNINKNFLATGIKLTTDLLFSTSVLLDDYALKSNLSPKFIDFFDKLGIPMDNNLKMYVFFGISPTETYGVDQGGIHTSCDYMLGFKKYSYYEAKRKSKELIEEGESAPVFWKVPSEDYKRLLEKLINQGFTENEATIILSSIDNTGVCTYASIANNILYSFKDDPEYFEKIFGYPMYKLDGTLNSNELLLDLYCFMNDTSNGGVLFENNHILESAILDTVDCFGNTMLDTNSQVFLSHFSNQNSLSIEPINKFLKSKSEKINITTTDIATPWGKNESKQYKENLANLIDEGYSISLIVNPKEDTIYMMSYDLSLYSNYNYTSGGHIMAVTGITSDGFVVSSWGNKYFISYDNLDGKDYFIIQANKIEYEEV